MAIKTQTPITSWWPTPRLAPAAPPPARRVRCAPPLPRAPNPAMPADDYEKAMKEAPAWRVSLTAGESGGSGGTIKVTYDPEPPLIRPVYSFSAAEVVKAMQ